MASEYEDLEPTPLPEGYWKKKLNLRYPDFPKGHEELYTAARKFGAALCVGGLAFKGESDRGQGTHTIGITAYGKLKTVESPTFPAHDLFPPNKEYKVIFRHSNAMRAEAAEDDAICQHRGTSIRIQYEDGKFQDILMNSGLAGFASSINFFWQFVLAIDRGQILDFMDANPVTKEVAKQGMRLPDSYHDLYYHSHVTYEFRPKDGSLHWMRWRIRPGDGRDEPDPTLTDEELQVLFDSWVPRKENDNRQKTFLRDEFSKRVKEGQVKYILELQLAPAGSDPNDHLLNALYAWDEAKYPFHVVGHVTVDQLRTQDPSGKLLRFNPGNMHPGIGVPLVGKVVIKPDDYASHLASRVLIYNKVADCRHAKPYPAAAIAKTMSRAGKIIKGAGVAAFKGKRSKNIDESSGTKPQTTGFESLPSRNSIISGTNAYEILCSGKLAGGQIPDRICLCLYGGGAGLTPGACSYSHLPMSEIIHLTDLNQVLKKELTSLYFNADCSDVGVPHTVELWSDGPTKDANWFCGHLAVTCLSTGKTHTFHFNTDISSERVKKTIL